MTRPRKRFAQHWLRSEAILEKIIAAAELKQSDRVLEIGPGTGILTRRLLEEVNALISVEIDRDLCKKLVKNFGDRENFILLQGDILELNLNETLTDFPKFQNPHKVVANIPYNITGPILERLLGTIAKPVTPAYDSIILLVQKEICDRLCAQPNSKSFGALSVRIQYLAECESICDVPAKAFYPPPKVNSAVIRLRPYLRENKVKDPRHLAMLIKLGFANKRKMLRNNLKSLIKPDRLSPLLEALNLNPQCRAENVSVEQWIALSDRLLDMQ
ncbi:MAG: 16S rRNA (adenine(1518)-N(6)/adenine(1519)-N(6))-dimethyltransferase RsmA [Cyanobacteria bacterium SBLK]|nr:16S rRNA (adenine(1518)-N(6)/adenine(1519)-N(6))-dimethyltransferase RsmA [Cyanobacteria bacterium SBLK]